MDASGRSSAASRPSAARSDETKAAAKKLGGTLNTAFICAAAAAAGDYHRAVGAPVEQLRASMAISTRTKESGSNAFSLARLLVPTGEMDMAERFRLIHEATDDGPRGVRHGRRWRRSPRSPPRCRRRS